MMETIDTGQEPVVGRNVLESPIMTAFLESMAEMGSPWLFGTDVPRGYFVVATR